MNPKLPKAFFILFSLVLFTSCEDNPKQSVIAIGTIGLVGAMLNKHDNTSNESSPCYGLDNKNCEPGISEDAIWEISLQEYALAGYQREVDNLSDFTHFMEFNAQNKIWQSHIFIKLPGSERYIHESRDGTFSFSGKNLEFLALQQLNTSCTDRSIIDIYDTDTETRKIIRFQQTHDLNLKDPTVNPHELSQQILDDGFNSSSFTTWLSSLIVSIYIYVLEIFFYMFTDDFWLSFLEADFHYQDQLWTKLELYKNQSTLSCVSENGIQAGYTSLLDTYTEEELELKMCESYVEGFALGAYDNESTLDDCEDLIEEHIIEEACGHLSGLEKDLCIALLD